MKKYIVLLIIGVVTMFWLVGFAQYHMTREDARTELMAKANRDMQESQRVAIAKAEVESAVRNIKGLVQQSINKPTMYYSIASQLVRNNQYIVGCGVAFTPDYYKEVGKQRLFAPYAFDENPEIKIKGKKVAAPQIRPTLLPFDYTTREWYNGPINTGSSLWTEPYMDQAGTHIVMVTYAMPFQDKNGQIAGVFFADVPLKEVSVMSHDLHLGFSRTGITVLILQLVMMCIFLIIVWIIVRASRRYKEEYVDPEKQHLIEQIEKLRTVNHKLTDRNMELAKKIQVKEQSTSSEWFG